MARVLHITRSDSSAGGADRAAYRIHRAARLAGVDSEMLVFDGTADDGHIHYLAKQRLRLLWHFAQKQADRWLCGRYGKAQTSGWCVARTPGFILPLIRKLNPDIVHLHWVCWGMLSIEEIGAIDRPIVWTVHDMWPATSGYSYLGDFLDQWIRDGRPEKQDGYDDSTGAINVTRRKHRHWRDRESKMALVAPSDWMERLLKASALFSKCPVHRIANPLPLQVYKPHDQSFARSVFGLPRHQRLIMTCAHAPLLDWRKGWDLFDQALQRLSQRMDPADLGVVIVGGKRGGNTSLYGFKVWSLGRLHDDVSMTLAMSACDCCILSSREDNLPNVACEAMASGTPCIAFRVGGLSDLISHGANGLLVDPYDTEALAASIAEMLAEPQRLRGFSEAARRQAEAMLDPIAQGAKYKSLYDDILVKSL